MASGAGRPMLTVYKNCRNCHGVDILKGLDNHITGLFFVFTADFIIRHGASTGDLAVEIIALSCSHRRNSHTCLCKCRSPTAVGMDNSAQRRKCLVQRHMGRCIGGRLPLSFYHIAIQIHNDHILRSHTVILHTGGLDDHQTAIPVNTRDISLCEGNKSMLRQQQIGLPYLLF